MRWPAARTRLSLIVTAASVVAACNSATESKEPKIELTVPGAAATVAQGTNTSIALTLKRTHFDDSVSLVVNGLPDGVTALLQPPTLTSGATSGQVFLSASGAATPGTVTVTVHATGTGVTEAIATFSLTVTVTGDFSLSALNTSVTVAQGGGGVASVLIARSGGNASNVAFVLTGVP